jgi:predicted nucleic acid-binding protein
MRSLFADTSYWIAIADTHDAKHEAATSMSKGLGQFRTVTSEMVLVEFLNSMSKCGSHLRRKAVTTVKSLLADPNVEVVPQTSVQLGDAMKRYEAVNDKGWGITDCASFDIMHAKGIGDALTYDHHFQQAGFGALLRERA